MGCQFLSNAKYGWVWSIFLYLISSTPIFGFSQLMICQVNTMRSCTEKELLARPPPLWRFWFLKRENKNCLRCIFYHSGEEKFCLKCDGPETTFGSGASLVRVALRTWGDLWNCVADSWGGGLHYRLHQALWCAPPSWRVQPDQEAWQSLAKGARGFRRLGIARENFCSEDDPPSAEDSGPVSFVGRESGEI